MSEQQRRFDNQVYWHCRRGVLELDVILQHYYHHHYVNLSDEGKQLFAHLLAQSDPQLIAWLVDRAEQPAEPQFVELVNVLRALPVATKTGKSDGDSTG